MSKLTPLKYMGERIGFAVYCPGCHMKHVIFTDESRAIYWEFNGDEDRPTFTPSLRYRRELGVKREKQVCHSFIRDGQWEFLKDCTHYLAGKTVDMLEVGEIR